MIMATNSNPQSSNLTSCDDSQQMEKELNYELQQSVAARERSRREQKLIPITKYATKGVSLAAAATPTPKSVPADKPFGISAPALYGALLAGMPALVGALVAAYNAPPGESAAVWKEAVPAIITSMGLGSAAGWLKNKIFERLVEFGPKLLSVDCLKSLGSMVKKFSGSLAQAAIEVGYNGILAFWHAIRWVKAKIEGDDETEEIERDNIKSIFSVDNAIGILAHVIAVTAGNTVAVTIAASGILGAGAGAAVLLAIPAVAWFLSDAITDALLQKKNEYGGWTPFINSGFGWFPDRRYKAWVGTEFDANKHKISQDLICPITLRVVFDPVRSTFTGHIYERVAIFKWLDEKGVDPILRGEKATRLDYIPAPTAKRWAHALAQRMGGQLEIVQL